MKYFLLGAFSSAFFLYGVALIYGATGTLLLTGIRDALAAHGDTSMALVGVALLSVGLLFKVGAVPFHSWIPDVYQGAPTPITGFMAAATKVAAFGALLRVVYVALPPLHDAVASGAVGDFDPDLGGRHHHRGEPGRCQTDAGLFVGRPRRFHPYRCYRRQPSRSCRHVVLPGRLQLQHGRCVRDRRPDPQLRRRRGRRPVALGRARTALPHCGRDAFDVSAGLRRYPIDQWIHQQADGVQGRRPGRRGAAGDHRCDRQRDRRLLLCPGDRARCSSTSRPTTPHTWWSRAS